VSDVIDPDERASITVAVLGALDAAERSFRGTLRVLRRQASALVVVFEQAQVRRHLAVHIRFRVRRTARIGQSENEPSKGSHDQPSFSSSLSTKPASRRHRSVCFSKPRTPAFVIV
jgi:hypothetical protein